MGSVECTQIPGCQNMSDLRFCEKKTRGKGRRAKKANIRPDKRELKIRRGSGPTPVARGGSGTEAPPLAARPEVYQNICGQRQYRSTASQATSHTRKHTHRRNMLTNPKLWMCCRTPRSSRCGICTRLCLRHIARAQSICSSSRTFCRTCQRPNTHSPYNTGSCSPYCSGSYYCSCWIPLVLRNLTHQYCSPPAHGPGESQKWPACAHHSERLHVYRDQHSG